EYVFTGPTVDGVVNKESGNIVSTGVQEQSLMITTSDSGLALKWKSDEYGNILYQATGSDGTRTGWFGLVSPSNTEDTTTDMGHGLGAITLSPVSSDPGDRFAGQAIVGAVENYIKDGLGYENLRQQFVADPGGTTSRLWSSGVSTVWNIGHALLSPQGRTKAAVHIANGVVNFFDHANEAYRNGDLPEF